LAHGGVAEVEGARHVHDPESGLNRAPAEERAGAAREPSAAAAAHVGLENRELGAHLPEERVEWSVRTPCGLRALHPRSETGSGARLVGGEEREGVGDGLERQGGRRPSRADRPPHG
jgi:hypothetical protein